MYCTNCGSPNQDDARFCCECGQPLCAARVSNTQQVVGLSTSQQPNQGPVGQVPPRRKRTAGVLAVVLVVLLIGSALGVGLWTLIRGMRTDGSPTTDVADTKKLPESAFLEVINRYDGMYGGHGTAESGMVYATGLALADSVDFDGDGTDELLVGYGEPTAGTASSYSKVEQHVEVWGFEHGEAVLLYKGEPSVSDAGNQVLLERYGDKVLLVEKDVMGKSMPSADFVTSYWGYRDGEFCVIRAYTRQTNSDATSTYVYTINGEEVSEEEFKAQAGTAGKDFEETSYSLASYDSEELQDTFSVTDDTVSRLEDLTQKSGGSSTDVSDEESGDDSKEDVPDVLPRKLITSFHMTYSNKKWPDQSYEEWVNATYDERGNITHKEITGDWPMGYEGEIGYSLTYEYDAEGRLIKQSGTEGESFASAHPGYTPSTVAWDITYEDDNRASHATGTEHSDQRHVEDVYGDGGELITRDYLIRTGQVVENGTLTFSYDATGRILGQSASRGYFGDQTSMSQFDMSVGYDTASRITSIETLDSSGKLFSRRTYDYDDAGRVTHRSHFYDGGGSKLTVNQSFVYDKDGHLSSIDQTDGDGWWAPAQATFTTDKDGSIVSARIESEGYTRTYEVEYITISTPRGQEPVNAVDLTNPVNPELYNELWVSHTNLDPTPYDESAFLRENRRWLELHEGSSSTMSAVFPRSFVFTSGAGGWSTTMDIAADGSFSGRYHDSNMGENIKQYPKGTLYETEFKGAFSDLAQVGDYEYELTVSTFDITTKSGEHEEDGMLVVGVGDRAYGIGTEESAPGGEAHLYAPGFAFADLPQEAREWPMVSYIVSDDGTLSSYVLVMDCDPDSHVYVWFESGN